MAQAKAAAASLDGLVARSSDAAVGQITQAAATPRHETVATEALQTGSGHPTVGLFSQQVSEANEVVVAAQTGDSRTVQTVKAPEIAANDIEKSSLGPPAISNEPTTGQQEQRPAITGAVGTDISPSGLLESRSLAGADGEPQQAQNGPGRGCSRKRGARWGPPANKLAEPVTDTTAEGEQTGRKKRRSRWEEPTAAAGDSQHLAVVDMSNGSGFPHEIVLAGGIKVSLDCTVPAVCMKC